MWLHIQINSAWGQSGLSMINLWLIWLPPQLQHLHSSSNREMRKCPCVWGSFPEQAQRPRWGSPHTWATVLSLFEWISQLKDRHNCFHIQRKEVKRKEKWTRGEWHKISTKKEEEMERKETAERGNERKERWSYLEMIFPGTIARNGQLGAIWSIQLTWMGLLQKVLERIWYEWFIADCSYRKSLKGSILIKFLLTN